MTHVQDAQTGSQSAGQPAASGPAGRGSTDMVLQMPPAATDVQRTFQLGWSVAELKGRIATSQKEQLQSAESKTPGNQLWRSSQWRVAFDRLSSLQEALGLNAPTANTIYDPGSGQPPFLFPETEPNYASGGAIPPDLNEILKGFDVRETTRRALNCLDLLYIDADLALRPEDAREKQNALIKAVEASASGDGETPLKVLTDRSVLLLEVWDAYLREQLAAAEFAKSSENALVAYEAGRALASLSWSLTAQTLDLEQQQMGGEHSQTEAVDPQAVAADQLAVADKLEAEWTNSFSDRNVGYLQHQLSVVGEALGATDTIHAVVRSLDVWQRTVNWLVESTPQAHGLGARPVLSRQLRVALVEQTSIWQALVLGEEEMASFTAPGLMERMYLETTMLVEQAFTPQVLASIEASALEATHEVLDPVVKNVSQTVQAISTDVGSAISTSVHAVVRPYLPWLAGLAVVLAAAVLIAISVPGAQGVAGGFSALGVLVLGWLHLNTSQRINAAADDLRSQLDNSVKNASAAVGNQIQAAGASLPGKVASVQKTAQDGVSAITQPGGLAANVAGGLLDYVKTATGNALKQITDDLADLRNMVAISYPLVDYVVVRTRSADPASIEDAKRADSAYDFLRNVVWNEDDKRQELLRVASAAFGPLGVVALGAMWQGKGAGNGSSSNAAAKPPVQPAPPQP